MNETAKSQVFAHRLDGKGGIEDVAANGHDTPPQYWMHGDLSQADAADWLSDLGVPSTIIDSLLRQNPRPRCFSNSRGTLLIVRALNLNPGQAPEDMVSLRMWIERDRLITIRNRMIFSVQDMHEQLLAGEGPCTIHDLMLGLLERIIDRISEYVDSLESRIDRIEETLEISTKENIRSDISQLRRHVATIRRYLAPQREALENFHRIPNQALTESDKYYVQELSDRIIRYVEDLDLLRERSQFLLEELMNRISQEQNARMYMLSIVASIFLPISFVTGVFGMNVAGLPWLENPLGFVFVCILMACIGSGILIYFFTRKWL